MRYALIVSVYLVTLVGLSNGATCDLTSFNFTGEAYAEVESTGDFQDAFTNPGNLNAITTIGSNYTQTELNWTLPFGATPVLTANSLVTFEKTADDGFTRNHYAESYFQFEFTISSSTDYVLNGNWGNLNTGGSEDLIGYTMFGPFSQVFADVPPFDNSGTSGSTFSESGTLAAGTYQLVFDIRLGEPLTNAELVQAGWTITDFSLATSFIPEPGSAAILSILGFFMLSTHSRRRHSAD